MGSTQRSDTRKALSLERLLRSWEKVPEMTLGQLIAEAAKEEVLRIAWTRGVEELLKEKDDTALAEMVERYVMRLGVLTDRIDEAR